jgi:ribonuclease G
VTERMTREIVVNVGRRETRVAMVEDGELAELKIERERDVLGNVYKGKVENIVRGLDAAFVDCGLDRNVFLHVSDAVLEEPTRQMLRRKMESFPPIGEVLEAGQEILVQVTKGSVGSKGPRATRRVSLPGRYLVLMVQGGSKVGVSRKIADDAERRRLRDLGEKVKPAGMGIIIRTRAEGVGRAELQRDIAFLTRLWSSIQRRAKRSPSPALIHEDLTLVFEIVRDVFSADISRFVLDDADVYAKVVDLVGQVASDLKGRVELYEGAKPIFVQWDLEKQIERALRPRVWLPQGGHIHIDQTEALTAIDVNSGKFTGARSLTDTILKTNLQAVEEVVRQVRVRDIGGIIVIDFIDMDNARHRREVMAKLKDELKGDRVRTRVAHLTPLGLVEMTRKRTGDPLNVQLQSTCPCCEGRGRIASFETTAIRIEERLRELVAKDGTKDFRVTCSPGVCLQLIGIDGDYARLLEDDLGRRVHVRCSTSIHPERFVINSGAPAGLNSEGLPFMPGDVITLEPGQALDIPSETLLALVDGCIIQIPDAPSALEKPLEVRLTEVTRSYVRATLTSARPKPARAARREPVAAEERELEAEVEVMEEGPSALTRPEEAPAHKRRRRPRGGRRKAAGKAAAAEEPAAPVEEPAPAESAAAPEPEETAPKRPARKRRPRASTRRRKAAPTAVEGVPEAAQADAPVAAAPRSEVPAAETADEAAPPAKRRPRRHAGPRRRKATATAPAEAAPEPAAPAVEPQPAAHEPPPDRPRSRWRRSARPRPTGGEDTG